MLNGCQAPHGAWRLLFRPYVTWEVFAFFPKAIETLAEKRRINKLIQTSFKRLSNFFQTSFDKPFLVKLRPMLPAHVT